MSAMPPRKTRTTGGAGEAHRLMTEKLASSCLDEADAKRLGIRVADTEELRALGLFPVAAMELPYFDLHGKRTGFKRWRYLADTRTGFAAMTDAKPVRYVQAKDSLQEAYLPPTIKQGWQAVSQDPTVGVAITEGELKAACSTIYAVPTIGLGGVWSFRSARKKKPLLDVFYDFVWAGREVRIAYDSDASTNPKVVQARSALARELTDLGAEVFIVEVPPAADGRKQGLDDYALSEGTEALDALMAGGEEFSLNAELHRLNEEVVYVQGNGVVVKYANGQMMKPNDFTNHHYSNRHHTEFYEDAAGNTRQRKKKTAVAWLDWPARGELQAITFRPGQGQVTEAREFNTWPGYGCQPKKGDVSPWRKLLDHIFAGHPDERLWFEQWLALPLQREGSKLYTAAVVWGVNTGTGKSLIGYSMKRIYGKTFQEIGDNELQDARNEWAINKCFVLGDDVTGHEQRALADRLKRMITQESMRLDPKYVPSYSVPDFINYYFTSNQPDAFFLEDDDRRMFVHEATCKPLPQEFYAGYREWLGNGGAEALFHHLLTLDLGDRTAQDRAPATEAKKRMAEDGLSELGQWVRRLKEDPDIVLKFGGAAMRGDLWSSADLLKIYDPEQRKRVTAGTVTKELKRAGFVQVYGGKQLRMPKSGQMRLFAVRNAEKWSVVTDSPTLAKHYDDTRGPIDRVKPKY